MPQATGSNSKIVIMEEATFATVPATTSGYVVPFVSEGLGAKVALQNSQVIRGGRDASKPVRGNTDISGNINTELNPFMGLLLKHTFGSVTSSTAAGGYQHVFKVGALPTGLTIEKQFTDLTRFFVYSGCRINRAQFEFNPDGFIPVSFDLMGAVVASCAVTSMKSTPTDYGHSPFQGFNITIQEGGSNIAVVTKASFSIDNALDGGNYVVGSQGQRRSLPEGTVVLNGAITCLFESMTMLQKGIDFTESSMKITSILGTGAGSAGNESIEFFIPELVYDRKDPVITGSKGILVDFNIVGFYDNSAEASSIQVTLKNAKANVLSP